MEKELSGKIINILFCGTGGQGVLTASEIVSLAAMYDGHHTKKSEVHGMAQRGGSVESHVRIGGKSADKAGNNVGNKVASPIIEPGKADFLVPFHKGEHDRMAYYLSKDGKDLLPDFETADKTLKDRKFINTYMLGVLSKHLTISKESWLKALEDGFKGKLAEENKKVFLEAAK